MKPTVIALTLAALSVISGPTASASAADMIATGTISTIGGQSLTVKVGEAVRGGETIIAVLH